MVHRKPKTGKSLGDSGLFVLIEWSPKNKLSPYDYCKSSRESVEWVCSECGWEWYASINNRTAKKNPTGCPACGGKTHKPQNGKSFADLHPDLIKEWSDKNNCSPWEVYPNEAKPERWWVCPICNTEYLMNCNHRSCGQSCNKKECVSYKISKSKSTPIVGLSLGDEHPDLISEWSPDNMLTPFDVKSGSHYKAVWICPKHGEYTATCYSRTRGHGCRLCANKLISEAKLQPKDGMTLLDVEPILVNEWAESNIKKPHDVSYGSDYLAEWVCIKCAHRWKTKVYQRGGIDKTGCPNCSHSGTSQIEQNLRTSLLPFGASTKPNTKLGKWNVDIYFPDSKTIVEYDGSWAHSHPGSIERDKRKSIYLLTQGYRVIRIREISHSFQLSSLEIRNKNYFEIFYKNGYHKKYSSVPTQDLIEEVRRLFNET